MRITTTFKFSLSFTGTNQLACDATTSSTERQATLTIGIPQIKYFVAPAESDDEESEEK